MKRILLTGCNGQLGRALQLEYGDSVEFIKTDVVEGDGIRLLDITDIDEVTKACLEVKPDVIINCAALTNVDGCEKTPDLAYRINAIGPRNLSIAAGEINAKIIHISTDYVFPGTSAKPLTEFDTPAPKSAYGRSKYAGEGFVREFSQKYFILRTAWLYGDGKNFVRTMLALSKTHDTLSVVSDQIGSPTSAKELAKTIRFLEGTDNYGIFHATCEGTTSWAEFAEDIFRIAKKDTKVIHVTSEEYKKINPDSADRPAYSVLDNYMLRLTSDYKMADYRDAFAEYMEGELKA